MKANQCKLGMRCALSPNGIRVEIVSFTIGNPSEVEVRVVASKVQYTVAPRRLTPIATPQSPVTRKPKAKAPPTKWIDDWTDPKDTSHDHMLRVLYFADGECECGVTKHHYHCIQCGRIAQVG